MKSSLYTVVFMVAMLLAGSATAQKYRTAADTFKLNKEYLQVSQDVATLTFKLNEAQNDLPNIVARAGSAESKAQSAAENSSSRASDATDGGVSDARKAKRSARNAYKKAKTSQSADNNVKRQEQKIAQLGKQLARKQKRLQELEQMRTVIYSSIMPIQG